MIRYFLITLFTLFNLQSNAAERHWVGGGSSANWNATTPTNWSATAGGPNDASVPGSSDDVIFSTGNAASTLSATTTVQSFSCTDYTGTLTHNASVTLTLSGVSSQFTLCSGITYNVSSNTNRVVQFTGAGPSTVTSAGKQLGTLQVNGSGSVTPLDVFTDLRQLTIVTGSFNMGGISGHQIGAITSTGNAVRSLDCGSSTITIFNTSGTLIDLSGNTNTTTLTNCTMVLTPLTPTTSTRTIQLANGPFGTIEIPSTNGIVAFATNNGTINTLRFSGYSQVTFAAGQSFTVSNWSTTASPNGPIVSSATNGTSTTIAAAAGSRVISGVALKDIAFTTATWSCTNCINWGAVTGIAISNSRSGGIIGG